MSSSVDHILTLSCADRPGIVHAVTGIFASMRHNILDLQQFSDSDADRFFMRVHFRSAADCADPLSTEHLQQPFEALATEFTALKYHFRPAARKTRTLIMVSKIGHCLNDLLFRMKTGQLNIEVGLSLQKQATGLTNY